MMNQLKYEATIVDGYANTCMYADMDYHEDWLIARTFAQTFLDITKGKEIKDLSQKEVLHLKQAAEPLRSVALDHANPAGPYVREWFLIHEFTENVIDNL